MSRAPPMNRGVAISWAIGLGLLAGSIGATITPSETAGDELRQIAGLFLVFTPALYVCVTRQWNVWRRTNPYIRFAVFHLSLFVIGGLLVRFAVLVLGSSGVVANVAFFSSVLVAFGIASWLTFYGGADRIWTGFIRRTDIDW